MWDIRGYSFDWDDNIIKMPTTIKMLKKIPDGWEPIEIGTDEFATIRNDENYKLDEGAFDHFIDDEDFLSDLENALENNSFAPSFAKFKEALIYANPIFYYYGERTESRGPKKRNGPSNFLYF